MKCGSFNDLVGVDSECDSWVLETIHGVVSGSATMIWKLNKLIREPTTWLCLKEKESGVVNESVGRG